MTSATSLSNRDCAALLREWGFQEVGYKGGHLVMEHDGRRVQITAPGRSTPTPYKALRKAARVVGVSLKDFLAGPVKEKAMAKKVAIATEATPVPVQKKENKMIAVAMEIEEVDDLEVGDPPSGTWTCEVCGKDDFLTERGFMGHLRGHEVVRCPICEESFSRLGYGSHSRSCLPARRRGRPRRPIAEVVERSARSAKAGVEMPEAILDLDDDDFPPVEAFKPRVQEPVPEKPAVPEFTTLAQAFLPDVEITPDVAEAFDRWGEATRSLFQAISKTK